MQKQVISFPEKILFKTDDNEAVLQRVVTIDRKTKDSMAVYKYTKSHTKMGLEFPVKMDYINNLLNNDFIECFD